MEKKGAGKVQESKLVEVKEITKLLDSSKILAVVNMQNLPARQLGSIRNKIRHEVKIKMAKRDILERALRASKNKNAEKLVPYLGGMPALMFSQLDPFQLFQKLKANQSNAPAKLGQVCPRDIEVKAGPTSLTPGPAISTLGNAGLQAGVEAGKIAIKQSRIIIRSGEVLVQKIVDVLNLLGIEPMVIGINLVAALEGEQIFEGKVLDIDMDVFKQNIALAHNEAFKLAVGLDMIIPETASFLITRAELDAKALAADLEKRTTQ